MVVVWWLCGGCMMVLKVEAPAEPRVEEGGPSLVDGMVVVWRLYGGCMVVV